MKRRYDTLNIIKQTLVTNILIIAPLIYVLLETQAGLIAATILRLCISTMIALIALITFKLAQRQMNLRFNYGLGKVEDIGGVFIAGASLFMVLVLLVHEFDGYSKNEVPATSMLAIIVLILMTLKNSFLFYNCYHNKSQSSLATAQKNVAILNLFNSSFTLLLLLIMMGVQEYPNLVIKIDLVGTILISFIVVMKTSSMIKYFTFNLLDCSLDEHNQLLLLKSLALNYDGFKTIKRLSSRHSGSHNFIEISLIFEPQLTIEEFDRVSEKIKKIIHNEVPNSIVLIEPCVEKDD